MRSIGIQCNDDDAVRTVMGHKRGSSDMLGVYNRLQVSDERLRAVSDHIHDWLFPVKAKAKGKAKTRAKKAATSAPESGDGQPAAPSEPAESQPAAG